MINKSFDSLTFADIEGLVDVGRAEDRRLDFKRELPGGKDDDRKEFLADVSSFANADGGDLIFGVDEVDGVAAGDPGIEIGNPDETILRLESLVRDGLQPRIIGLRSAHIAHPSRSGTGVIVMRVPASLQAPHQVIFKGRNRFYTRHSKGKAEMDVDELRLAFTGSENIRPRLRALHGLLPQLSTIPLLPGPDLLVTVAPIGVFRRQSDLELSGRDDAVMPSWGGSLDWAQTLEGFLAWAPTANGSYAQAMTYRAGWVEMWSSEGSPHKPESRWVWAGAIEKNMRSAVLRSLQVLQAHGVEGPWFVKARLHHVKGYDLHTGDRWGLDEAPTSRDTFAFNDIVFDEFSEATLLPMFRELWWSFGKDRPVGWVPPK